MSADIEAKKAPERLCIGANFVGGLELFDGMLDRLRPSSRSSIGGLWGSAQALALVAP